MKRFLSAVVLLACSWSAPAQELEPRRWSHLPIDVNFAGAGYAFSRADILFDPVLEIENVTLDKHTFAASYIRTFELLDHSARVDVTVPYQDARWEGLLQGEPAATSRQGFADPVVRFSVNLAGGPPLKGAEFAEYQAEHPVNTIVGAGVAVQVPLGEYYSEKLLNLGENRFVIRPAFGVVHNHGKWSEELTGSVWFFTDNSDFYGGDTREEDPLPMLQAHLIYAFRPGVWASASAGYAYGGESYVDGVPKDDTKENIGGALSFGYSFTRSVGVKIAYAHTETRENTGFDSDSLITAMSVLW